MSNWGTPIEPTDFEKWETDYSKPISIASLIFTTHWSAPTVYIFIVSEKYPELTFSLFQYKAEENFEYITVRNGKPVDDYKAEYNDELWDIRSSQEKWEQDTSLDYLDPAFMGRNMEEYKEFLDCSNE